MGPERGRRRLARPVLVAIGFLGPWALRTADVAFGAGWCRRGAARAATRTANALAAERHSPPALPADEEAARAMGRRRDAVLVALGGAVAVLRPAPASALVQGNAVPEGYEAQVKRFRGQRPKNCKTVDECREIGEEKARQSMAADGDTVYSVTTSGARYKDVEEGSKSGGVAKKGDPVQLRFRVMRSGKRSRDGISGEASTIFSLGYGEDDAKDKKATLSAQLGAGKLVKAIDEGVVGMAVGGTRRIQVKSENGMGWKKEGNCAATSDLGVQVISAGQDNDLCLDETKLPQPADYGAKRRFFRRFDENLIVEVELASVGGS